MFLLDGKRLPLDKPFKHAGISYPANWLRLATPQEREAIGITERQERIINWDQRFYWGRTQEGDLIPKDHADLVRLWSANTRQSSNTLLVPTDWMVVREADSGTVMDADWKAWRQSVRTAAAEKVAAIEATTTTDELAAYITSGTYSTWPNDPDHPPVVAADDSGDGVGTAVDGEDAGLSDTIDFSSSTTSAGIV